MKKEYTSPKMIITSYEAGSEIMFNLSNVTTQTNVPTKKYSEINF